jgi:ribosome-associated protein
MKEKTLELQNAIVEALMDKRALDVVSLEVTEVTPLADSFIITSGNSDVHMNALVNAVTDCLDKFHEPYKLEGEASTQWTLIDAGDIVVHVFSVKAREFYKLERIWGDVKIKHYESRD